jgi:DNA (cytosine-5)-methyltransferase 1
MADGQGKTQLSAAYLTKYYGADQDPRLEDPLHTATAKARFGLAEVLLRAPPFAPEHHARARLVADLLRSHGLWDEREFVTVEIDGVTCVIVDLGLRMFTPRELFRAQGFPDSYVIDRRPDGTPISKTEQVAKCGNSVCPPMAAALVAANYQPGEVERVTNAMEAAE